MSDLGGGLDQKPAIQCPRALPVFDGCAGGQRGRVAVVGSRGGVAHQWMEGERPSWPRWCCRALPMALVVGQNGPWVDCFPCHYHRIVAATSSGASVETDREKAAEWGLFKSDVCLACLLPLPPASCLHLIRFMHSALALWLSHNAFSSLHWTADRGQLASVETARLV